MIKILISMGILLLSAGFLISVGSNTQHVGALCIAPTPSTMAGTWISNDQTYNQITQNGNWIEWNGKTHDELGRIYPYHINGTISVITEHPEPNVTKTRGTISGYLKFTVPGSHPDPQLQHITMNMTWYHNPPNIERINRVPSYPAGDFASYTWRKYCPDTR